LAKALPDLKLGVITKKVTSGSRIYRIKAKHGLVFIAAIIAVAVVEAAVFFVAVVALTTAAAFADPLVSAEHLGD